MESLTDAELHNRYHDRWVVREYYASGHMTHKFELVSAELLAMRKEIARRAQQARLARKRDI